MINWIRTIYPHGLNKGFSSKFYVGSWVQQETLEAGLRMHLLKYCEYNNKAEDNNLNTVNDKEYPATSKKFRQITCVIPNLEYFIHLGILINYDTDILNYFFTMLWNIHFKLYFLL